MQPCLPPLQQMNSSNSGGGTAVESACKNQGAGIAGMLPALVASVGVTDIELP